VPVALVRLRPATLRLASRAVSPIRRAKIAPCGTSGGAASGLGATVRAATVRAATGRGGTVVSGALAKGAMTTAAVTTAGPGTGVPRKTVVPGETVVPHVMGVPRGRNGAGGATGLLATGTAVSTANVPPAAVRRVAARGRPSGVDGGEEQRYVRDILQAGARRASAGTPGREDISDVSWRPRP